MRYVRKRDFTIFYSYLVLESEVLITPKVMDETLVLSPDVVASLLVIPGVFASTATWRIVVAVISALDKGSNMCRNFISIYTFITNAAGYAHTHSFLDHINTWWLLSFLVEWKCPSDSGYSSPSIYLETVHALKINFWTDFQHYH